jgi:hypothetical protein
MERLDPRDQELCARVFDRLVPPSGAKVACRLGDLTNWAKDLATEVPRVTKILEDNRLLAFYGEDIINEWREPAGEFTRKILK